MEVTMSIRIVSAALSIGFLSICAAFAEPSRSVDATLQNPPTGASPGSGLGFEQWGVRVGATDDVDQVVGGVQFNFGEVVPDLRLQPDVELGSGDDATTLYGTVPVYYRFHARRMTPYAGGGLALGWVDRDLPPGASGDDGSFEVGGRATGGLEWDRRKGQFFVEVSLGFGDVHDVRAVAAWMF
jgi:opacity protein-like surface antigen